MFNCQQVTYSAPWRWAALEPSFWAADAACHTVYRIQKPFTLMGVVCGAPEKGGAVFHLAQNQQSENGEIEYHEMSMSILWFVVASCPRWEDIPDVSWLYHIISYSINILTSYITQMIPIYSGSQFVGVLFHVAVAAVSTARRCTAVDMIVVQRQFVFWKLNFWK